MIDVVSSSPPQVYNDVGDFSDDSDVAESAQKKSKTIPKKNAKVHPLFSGGCEPLKKPPSPKKRANPRKKKDTSQTIARDPIGQKDLQDDACPLPLEAMFDDHESSVQVKAEPTWGDAFVGDYKGATLADAVDLTEDLAGDEYECDKYEVTQAEPPDAAGLDGDYDFDQEFAAFDWDPSQPTANDSSTRDSLHDTTPNTSGLDDACTNSDFPFRGISSLPDPIKTFYLTHWCRESKRRSDAPVGHEAQLANDRLVLAEKAAGAERQRQGKTWDNAAAQRSGSYESASGTRGKKSTRGRGGGSAARGKAFYIQRAIRARAAGGKRGRGR